MSGLTIGSSGINRRPVWDPCLVPKPLRLARQLPAHPSDCRGLKPVVGSFGLVLYSRLERNV
jgi:hypothetical protein